MCPIRFAPIAIGNYEMDIDSDGGSSETSVLLTIGGIISLRFDNFLFFELHTVTVCLTVIRSMSYIICLCFGLVPRRRRFYA